MQPQVLLYCYDDNTSEMTLVKMGRKKKEVGKTYRVFKEEH
jgi:hypothetical protein